MRKSANTRLEWYGTLPAAALDLGFQVAAVCYRQSGADVEFLLVNTKDGRWTFPKGSIGPRTLPHQAALKEATEEAGVRGRIVAEPFHTYLHRKCGGAKERNHQVQVVTAYLLEVQHAGAPEEAFRNPTWCAPETAKALLAQGRQAKWAQELGRVIDVALESLLGNPQRAASRAGDRVGAD
jgi:8-oxo-dGTP pyrophosphatase MutT (NUDIX family)